MAYEYLTQYDSPNYRPGRPAGAPNVIVIHYWDDPAKKPSFMGVVSWLCRKDGNSSAHYIAEAGRVACIVAPRDRAWHAGPGGNPRGIGIECNPRMTAGDLETVAELIANLRKTYGNLPLKPHKAYINTSCPGAYEGQLAWLSNRANQILGGKPATTPPVVTKPTAPATGKSIETLAQEVIAGKYGTGAARQNALGSQYAAVQKRVNEILAGSKTAQSTANKVPGASADLDQVARDVINGKYGNGAARTTALTNAGHNAAAVQARVNAMLGATASTPKGSKSIDTVAREVIRGDYGNGAERKRLVEAAGYNYAAVQARVNQLVS